MAAPTLPYPCSVTVFKDSGKPAVGVDLHSDRSWFTFGNHEDCDVRIHAPGIAALHAMIEVKPDKVLLHGLDYIYPVFIPRTKKSIRRQESVSLSNDDVFMLGKRKFSVTFDSPILTILNASYAPSSTSVEFTSCTSSEPVSEATHPVVDSSKPQPQPAPPTKSARKRRTSLVVTASDETFVHNMADPSRLVQRLPLPTNTADKHSNPIKSPRKVSTRRVDDTLEPETVAPATPKKSSTPAPAAFQPRVRKTPSASRATPSRVTRSRSRDVGSPRAQKKVPFATDDEEKKKDATLKPPTGRVAAATPARMLTRSAVKANLSLPPPAQDIPSEPPLLDSLSASERRELVYSRLCSGLPATPLRGAGTASKSKSRLPVLGDTSESQPGKSDDSGNESRELFVVSQSSGEDAVMETDSTNEDMSANRQVQLPAPAIQDPNLNRSGADIDQLSSSIKDVSLQPNSKSPSDPSEEPEEDTGDAEDAEDIGSLTDDDPTMEEEEAEGSKAAEGSEGEPQETRVQGESDQGSTSRTVSSDLPEDDLLEDAAVHAAQSGGTEGHHVEPDEMPLTNTQESVRSRESVDHSEKVFYGRPEEHGSEEKGHESTEPQISSSTDSLQESALVEERSRDSEFSTEDGDLKTVLDAIESLSNVPYALESTANNSKTIEPEDDFVSGVDSKDEDHSEQEIEGVLKPNQMTSAERESTATDSDRVSSVNLLVAKFEDKTLSKTLRPLILPMPKSLQSGVDSSSLPKVSVQVTELESQMKNVCLSESSKRMDDTAIDDAADRAHDDDSIKVTGTIQVERERESENLPPKCQHERQALPTGVNSVKVDAKVLKRLTQSTLEHPDLRSINNTTVTLELTNTEAAEALSHENPEKSNNTVETSKVVAVDQCHIGDDDKEATLPEQPAQYLSFPIVVEDIAEHHLKESSSDACLDKQDTGANLDSVGELLEAVRNAEEGIQSTNLPDTSERKESIGLGELEREKSVRHEVGIEDQVEATKEIHESVEYFPPDSSNDVNQSINQHDPPDENTEGSVSNTLESMRSGENLVDTREVESSVNIHVVRTCSTEKIENLKDVLADAKSPVQSEARCDENSASENDDVDLVMNTGDQQIQDAEKTVSISYEENDADGAVEDILENPSADRTCKSEETSPQHTADAMEVDSESEKRLNSPVFDRADEIQDSRDSKSGMGSDSPADNTLSNASSCQSHRSDVPGTSPTLDTGYEGDDFNAKGAIQDNFQFKNSSGEMENAAVVKRRDRVTGPNESSKEESIGDLHDDRTHPDSQEGVNKVTAGQNLLAQSAAVEVPPDSGSPGTEWNANQLTNGSPVISKDGPRGDTIDREEILDDEGSQLISNEKTGNGDLPQVEDSTTNDVVETCDYAMDRGIPPDRLDFHSSRNNESGIMRPSRSEHSEEGDVGEANAAASDLQKAATRTEFNAELANEEQPIDADSIGGEQEIVTNSDVPQSSDVDMTETGESDNSTVDATHIDNHGKSESKNCPSKSIESPDADDPMDDGENSEEHLEQMTGFVHDTCDDIAADTGAREETCLQDTTPAQNFEKQQSGLFLSNHGPETITEDPQTATDDTECDVQVPRDSSGNSHVGGKDDKNSYRGSNSAEELGPLSKDNKDSSTSSGDNASVGVPGPEHSLEGKLKIIDGPTDRENDGDAVEVDEEVGEESDAEINDRDDEESDAEIDDRVGEEPDAEVDDRVGEESDSEVDDRVGEESDSEVDDRVGDEVGVEGEGREVEVVDEAGVDGEGREVEVVDEVGVEGEGREVEVVDEELEVYEMADDGAEEENVEENDREAYLETDGETDGEMEEELDSQEDTVSPYPGEAHVEDADPNRPIPSTPQCDETYASSKDSPREYGHGEEGDETSNRSGEDFAATAADLNCLTVKDLRAMLKKEHLPVGGIKPELIARLLLHRGGSAAEVDEAINILPTPKGKTPRKLDTRDALDSAQPSVRRSARVSRKLQLKDCMESSDSEEIGDDVYLNVSNENEGFVDNGEQLEALSSEMAEAKEGLSASLDSEGVVDSSSDGMIEDESGEDMQSNLRLYSQKTVKELKEILSDMGIEVKYKAKKADLVQAVVANLSGCNLERPEAEDKAESEDSLPPAPNPHTASRGTTVKEMRESLKNMGLCHAGTKVVLQKRIDDALGDNTRRTRRSVAADNTVCSSCRAGNDCEASAT